MNRKRRAVRIALWTLAAIALAAIVVAANLYLPEFRIQRAERAALSQLGKPYEFGAAGPDAFDCSGLMCYAYERAGVRLAHNTKAVADDSRYRTVSDPAELRPGDLVYFDTISGGSRTDHVGLWLGNGRFVHASSAEGEVILSEFDERWQRRFSWAKRILGS